LRQMWENADLSTALRSVENHPGGRSANGCGLPPLLRKDGAP
jgi:hypothetical protein